MRATLTTILTLATCAAAALAYVADVFSCIEPAAHCCRSVSTTGIGVNCYPAKPTNLYTMLNITEDAISLPANGYQYASACFNIPHWKDYPGVSQVPKSTSMTSDLKTFDCLPPEEGVMTYNSATDEITLHNRGWYSKDGSYAKDGSSDAIPAGTYKIKAAWLREAKSSGYDLDVFDIDEDYDLYE
ncbi:uncharacterized protein PAC_01351 [Phialocephala subalpina]|uniref:Uncharacterized protein n=1 Tax=Phialocephala subalpina TaxID=576137 RepID=A0A1L7WFE5_9HELO|nr:uncharacterized protein PAC_01351 [Phialocephala subalpina]